jgi:predicted membrane-bound mannosyltransferase
MLRRCPQCNRTYEDATLAFCLEDGAPLTSVSAPSPESKKLKPSAPTVELPKESELTWRISAAAILFVGAFLRLFKLSLVPLHHDEGVNGNFLISLVRDGNYSYDPQNYHGPTLYYFSAVIPWIVRFFGGKAAGDAYGLTTFNIRLVPAAFGIATILLALMLRKRIGTVGALCAAGLIAISPGAIYLSRYFIHESLFVFFTLGIVFSALRYYDSGRSDYLILAAISGALMVATKETWVINGPVLLIALVTTTLYFTLRERLHANEDSGWQASHVHESLGGPVSLATITLVAFAVFVIVIMLFHSSFTDYSKVVSKVGLGWLRWIVVLIVATIHFALRKAFNGKQEAGAESAQRRPTLARFGGPIPLATIALVAFAVFILVNVLFYSSFFTNYPKGVSDAMKTLNLWRQRVHEHEHPWYQYIYWLLWQEGAVMVLASFGALIAVWRANNRLALFLALWSFGLLAAYSLVGYKTPWITLNFIVPLALTSGYTLEVVYQKLREFQQPLFFLLIPVLIVGLCGYQLYQLNFVHYDDDQLPYVYAHTKRQMLTMLDQIDRIAAKNGTGTDTGVAIVSPDYWPLPWYFRDYKRVGYYQQIVPTNEAIIIGSKAQVDQMKSTYGDRYDQLTSPYDEGAYPLRPGVDLLLYVRRDVKR